jgi:hypothetical protein
MDLFPVLCQDAESPTKRLMLHCLRVKVAGTEVLAPQADGATPGWPRAWRFGFSTPVGCDMINIDQQGWVQVCFVGYTIFAFTNLCVFFFATTQKPHWSHFRFRKLKTFKQPLSHHSARHMCNIVFLVA